ncbi:MAG: hypothetical protein NT025_02990 [bacterium]|nr:hypothetical protein [bacterium]
MKTQSQICSCYRSCHMLLCLIALLLSKGIVSGQTFGDAVMGYEPEDGLDVPAAAACASPSWPDSGCFSFPIMLRGHLPGMGYPMRWAIFAGLNDTVAAWINFFNRTDKSYALSDKDCEHWYVPRLYLLEAIGPGAAPLAQSDSLGYRVRGWFVGNERGEPQSKLPPLPDGGMGLMMDVWNLPQGRFQVCFEPTEKVPSDFRAMGGGLTYEFYPPRSLADSVNAYEGCFWRAIWDKDYDAAEKWVDAMLTINPTSVPGNWFKAFRALEVQDTATAKQALDDALKYLNDRSDPAMPDSTVRPLFQAEKLYLQEMERVLSDNRRRLGP